MTSSACQNHRKTMEKRLLIITTIVMMMCTGISSATQYTLTVQPILPPDEINLQYKALADYLSAKTGDKIRLIAARDFRTYFTKMKSKQGYDMILDAAHFTDYRIKHMGYKVLAKLPHTVSFTLVTGPDLFIFEPEELAHRKIASMMSPSIDRLRLKKMFPDKKNMPIFIKVNNIKDAVKKIFDGTVDAAMIPTPLVGNFEGLNTVLTSEPIPHMGFSVSPKVPPVVAAKIKKALLEANRTEAGKKMLADANISNFVSANKNIYDGYEDLLNLYKK